MSNPIYEEDMRKGSQQNPMQMLQNLKRDPIGFIKHMGFNVPDGVNTSNPRAIIGSLIQSGQISNNTYQKVIQRMMHR